MSGSSSINTDKSVSLPKTSVRRLMKISDEVSNVSQEAVSLVGKSTEEFITTLALDALVVCAENNRKTIGVEDVVKAIHANPRRNEFLLTAITSNKLKK